MGHRHTPHGRMCVIRLLFNSSTFAISADVCALLSAILVDNIISRTFKLKFKLQVTVGEVDSFNAHYSRFISVATCQV